MLDPWQQPRAAGLGAGVALLLVLVLSLGLFHGRGLHDTDAAYHLAVARTYATEGIPENFPQARLSLFRDGFGDKEFLFHLCLAPFTGADPAATLAGGRLALALLNALLAALLAWLALRALGWWGVILPLWLPLASGEFAWRLVRLRPELLALPLLLLAIVFAARERYRWLALIALLFTWSYTAFHALGGLLVLLALAFAWRERKLPWALLLYTGLGIGLGLVLHPHFPHNLQVWAVQNLAFFQLKSSLSVGTEIRPNFTDVALMVHLGWLVMLAGLWRARVDREGQARLAGARFERRLADALGVAAFCFTLLYLLMSRFSLYAVPLLTLWLLAEIHARGQRIGRWVALPAGRRLPLAVVIALSLLLSVPVAVREFQRFRERTFLGPEGERLADLRALGSAIPEGAPVAADWGSTATYLLWAPQGRYLNALDPVFMAVPYPQEYHTLRRILDGEEPDIPRAAVEGLASPFLAYPLAPRPEALEARLARDPRVVVLHQGFHKVVRFQPAPEAFVVDWQTADAAHAVGSAGLLAGYIDAHRAPGMTSDARCLRLERRQVVTEPLLEVYELAPAGATTLSLDDRPLATVYGDLGAVLGQGVEVRAALTPGEHRWRILTCRERQGERFGFYLRRLPLPGK